MPTVIDPKIEVVDYGPEIDLGNGEKITADEIVYGASRIAFKDIGVLRELIEARKEGESVREKMIKSVIKSAGSGHASMATTPGMWVFMQGNCSKLVDSIFTTARFSSSLMPSGRRVGIDVDQIVVPQGIHQNPEAEKLYIETSVANIQTYEKLMERGVEKQHAAKIVQYGHRGGGAMFMPLETLVYFSKLLESQFCEMPQEGREIISQLEGFVHEHGLEVVYESRRNAPRTGCPNPDIFHSRYNEVDDLMQEHPGIVDPVLVSIDSIDRSSERDSRIENLIHLRENIFKESGKIKENWRMLLRELDEIVQDYNNSFSVTTFANSPWRVWGEVKRHRTLSQTAESVYHAASRALCVVREYNPDIIESHLPVVSIPKSVAKDRDNLKMWIDAFSDSMNAYNKMTEMGIPVSDAIAVIPRGLKLGIVKRYDLYNLLTGFLPLRLCSTAEPEMRETCEKERDLILNSSLPSKIRRLVGPKCYSVGFCAEPDYKRCCGKIRALVPGYDEAFHSEFQGMREQEILAELEN